MSGRLLSVDDKIVLKLAAQMNPAFARKYGMPVAAVDDYDASTVLVTNYPQDVPVGDALFIDVAGQVVDIAGGFPDDWQIVVAGAAIDGSKKPLTNLRAFVYDTSPIQGSPTPFSNTILLEDAIATHNHLVLGTMPQSGVNLQVQIFANHSRATSWNWTQWQYTNGPLPTGGWDMVKLIDIPGQINPPPKPMNWLLIGGIFLVVAGGFAAWSITRK